MNAVDYICVIGKNCDGYLFYFKMKEFFIFVITSDRNV